MGCMMYSLQGRILYKCQYSLFLEGENWQLYLLSSRAFKIEMKKKSLCKIYSDIYF